MTETLLKVCIKNRKRTYMNEDALTVTSYNNKGIFDILPFHANFISLISNLIVVKTPSAIKKLQFDSGVMHVQNDSVFLYISDLDPYFEEENINSK